MTATVQDDQVTERPIEEVEAELVALAGRIAAAEQHFLELLGEFDERGGWVGDGILSLEHWLSWRCGVARGTARDRIRTARRLRALPRTSEAMAAGRLSYSKVRALVRVATPETEEGLVTTATECTAGQLERHVRAIKRCDPDRRDVDPPECKPYGVRWRYDDDGDFVFSGRLDAEQGAQLLAVLQATVRADGARTADSEDDVCAEAPDGDVSAETPCGSPVRATGPGSCSARAWGHLAEAATKGLAKLTGAPASLAPFSEVVVHVDADLLTRLRTMQADRCGRSHYDDGPAVALETIERLACDGGIRLTTHGSDGRTLDLGRRRNPTARQNQALLRRDGGCAFPGCARRRFLHAHHVCHWARGGSTRLDNLVLLCGEHHRALHAGAYCIVALGQAAVLVPHRRERRDRRRPDGRRLVLGADDCLRLGRRDCDRAGLVGGPDGP